MFGIKGFVKALEIISQRRCSAQGSLIIAIESTRLTKYLKPKAPLAFFAGSFHSYFVSDKKLFIKEFALRQ